MLCFAVVVVALVVSVVAAGIADVFAVFVVAVAVDCVDAVYVPVAAVAVAVFASVAVFLVAAALVLANGVRELVRPQPPISCLTLVVTCENDTGSTPSMSRAIGSEIDGAKVQIISRLQHLGLIEDPAAFTVPILAFCERTKT